MLTVDQYRSATMPSQHLPVELWLKVIEQLPRVYDNKDAVVALSSTSRDFRAVCLPYIFEDVGVSYLVQKEQFNHIPRPNVNLETLQDGRYLRRAYRATIPTLDEFAIVLNEKRKIASLIRLITLEPCYDVACDPVYDSEEEDIEGWPVRPDVLLSVFHALPNLSGIQLRHTCLHGTSDAVAQAVSAYGKVSIDHLWLTRFHLVYATPGEVDTQHLVDLLSLFTHVEDLRMVALGDFYETESYSFPPDFQVKSVYVRCPVAGTLRALVASPSLHLLTSLDIGDQFFGLDGTEIPVLLGILPSIGGQLRHLGFGMQTLSDPAYLDGMRLIYLRLRIAADC